jgi:hypothetical protein
MSVMPVDDDIVKLIRVQLNSGVEIESIPGVFVDSGYKNGDPHQVVATSLIRLADESMSTAVLLIVSSMVLVAYVLMMVGFNLYQAMTGNLYTSSPFWWGIWGLSSLSVAVLVWKALSQLQLALAYRSIGLHNSGDSPPEA